MPKSRLAEHNQAKQLWRVLTKLVGLEAELRNRIKFDDTGYFDNTEIIGDYNILQQAATMPQQTSQANVSPKSSPQQSTAYHWLLWSPTQQV